MSPHRRAAPWRVALAGGLLLLLAVGSAPAWGEGLPSPLRAYVPGSFKAITQGEKAGDILLSFWSISCGPCRKEMPVLRAFQQRHPQVRVVLVSTDAPEDADAVMEVLEQAQMLGVENWIFNDTFVERLRFEVSPRWRGELPLNYLRRSNGKSALVMGAIPEDQLEQWFQ